MFAAHDYFPVLACSGCAAGVYGSDFGFAARMSDAAEHTSNPDVLLLQRMACGDREAFSDFYDRYKRPLYCVAVRILGDSREAEDIAQDAFLSIWEKAAEFSSARGTPFAWAVTLLRNRAIDRLRQRRRRGELLSASAPADLGYGESADTADPLVFKEKAGRVRSALAALPAEQKQALELAFFSGLTQEQIAQQLAQPLGTVKARIRRGLLKLRDALHSEHD